jgi:hypothetical protein
MARECVKRRQLVVLNQGAVFVIKRIIINVPAGRGVVFLGAKNLDCALCDTVCRMKGVC